MNEIIHKCSKCKSTFIERFSRPNNESGIRCRSCGHQKITTRAANYTSPIQGAYVYKHNGITEF